MGKFYDSISDDLKEWILKQPVFFTGSAPDVGKHINVSPKGLADSTFTVINPNKVAYIDYTGSGAETIAHLYDNGRITIMFNSFDPSPRICRLFSTGKVIEREDPEFEEAFKVFGLDEVPGGTRAIIVLDVFKVQTSCGYGVPIINGEFQTRTTIQDWGDKQEKVPGKLADYQATKNYVSLDGLPSLRSARRQRGESLAAAEVKRAVRRWEANLDAVGVGLLFGFAAGVALSRRLS